MAAGADSAVIADSADEPAPEMAAGAAPEQILPVGHMHEDADAAADVRLYVSWLDRLMSPFPVPPFSADDFAAHQARAEEVFQQAIAMTDSEKAAIAAEFGIDAATASRMTMRKRPRHCRCPDCREYRPVCGCPDCVV